MELSRYGRLRCLTTVVFVLSTLGVGGSAMADDNAADLGRGHDLAKRWCATCHAIEAGETEGFLAKVPAFQALADQTSTTELSLRAFLQTPHPTMPNIKLEPADTDALVAYILSLRKH
ncbi:MAG TPA: c-type cytochrome [Stellaceae bacterium]|nr:c-type cytochrome [Stellaceae bacterium]